MNNKEADRFRGKPKGRAYCDTPGTSCWYNSNDVCVNCGRPKGWRYMKVNFVPEVNGKRVCDPYTTQMEAEAFGSGYATALRDTLSGITRQPEVEIVTVAEDGTEIERSPL